MPIKRVIQYQVLARPILVVVPFGWLRPLNEPVRRHPQSQNAISAPSFFYPYQTVVEVSLVSKWFRPWSEPVMQPKRLRAEHNPALFWVQANFGESPDFPKWGYPWSEPVRVKRDPKANTALMASGPYFPIQPYPEVVVPSEWWRPFSEPVRFPARLTTANQQAAFLTNPYPTLPAPLVYGYVIM